MQARFCKPLPENAAVVDALTLLAKYEGSLAADQTPNAPPGQDSFNRRVWCCLPVQCNRAGGSLGQAVHRGGVICMHAGQEQQTSGWLKSSSCLAP